MEREAKIPDSVRTVLWSYDVDCIDPDVHKRLIVCQVLNFGTEDAIKWLFKLYGREEVARVTGGIPLGQWDKKSLSLVASFGDQTNIESSTDGHCMSANLFLDILDGSRRDMLPLFEPLKRGLYYTNQTTRAPNACSQSQFSYNPSET